MEGRTISASEHLRFPQRDLEEIVVWGYYRPENPNRLDSFRQEVIRQGHLKPGEIFEEKYRHFLKELNENFYYASMSYCYNVSSDRAPVFKNHFESRLYDKDGKLLTKDFLRLEDMDDDKDTFLLVAYLPYHKTGHEIRIVKLKGKEAILFDKLRANISHSELIRVSPPYDPSNRVGTGWTFDEKSQCFIAPPL